MDPVDVRDLLATPGASRRVTVEETFEGLGTELARIPAAPPVRMEILLESVVEGILVSGPLSGRVAYRCARCLRPFDGDFEVEVNEVFAPDATDEGDEYPIIGEGLIDLEPMVRDAVVLELPFSPLCRSECRGLCERCGGDGNLGECTCGPEVDPRWTPLDRLELDD